MALFREEFDEVTVFLCNPDVEDDISLWRGVCYM